MGDWASGFIVGFISGVAVAIFAVGVILRVAIRRLNSRRGGQESTGEDPSDRWLAEWACAVPRRVIDLDLADLGRFRKRGRHYE